MSERIGFDQDGWTDEMDPDLIDYRCAFKWGYTLPSNPIPSGTANFSLSFEQTYELFRRARLVNLNWGVIDSVSGNSYGGGGNTSPASNASTTEERGRCCADGIFAGIDAGGLGSMTFICDGYFPGSVGTPGTFSFSCFLGTPVCSTTDQGSGVAFFADFFGEPVPIYNGAGASVSGSASASISDWFAYDNGSGPVWNVLNGTQLIVPAPFGI